MPDKILKKIPLGDTAKSMRLFPQAEKFFKELQRSLGDGFFAAEKTTTQGRFKFQRVTKDLFKVFITSGKEAPVFAYYPYYGAYNEDRSMVLFFGALYRGKSKYYPTNWVDDPAFLNNTYLTLYGVSWLRAYYIAKDLFFVINFRQAQGDGPPDRIADLEYSSISQAFLFNAATGVYSPCNELYHASFNAPRHGNGGYNTDSEGNLYATDFFSSTYAWGDELLGKLHVFKLIPAETTIGWEWEEFIPVTQPPRSGLDNDFLIFGGEHGIWNSHCFAVESDKIYAMMYDENYDTAEVVVFNTNGTQSWLGGFPFTTEEIRGGIRYRKDFVYIFPYEMSGKYTVFCRYNTDEYTVGESPNTWDYYYEVKVFYCPRTSVLFGPDTVEKTVRIANYKPDYDNQYLGLMGGWQVFHVFNEVDGEDASFWIIFTDIDYVSGKSNFIVKLDNNFENPRIIYTTAVDVVFTMIKTAKDGKTGTFFLNAGVFPYTAVHADFVNEVFTPMPHPAPTESSLYRWRGGICLTT